jgi:hypothetical protein
LPPAPQPVNQRPRHLHTPRSSQHNHASCTGGPACPPPLLNVEQAARLATPDVRVEQAARLAMPAVTPAEQHNPERCGSPQRHPARTTARSTSTRALWSKPPGCHRATRSAAVGEFDTPTAARTGGVTHDCALHLKPPCPPCPPWFAFLRVLRGLFFSVFSVFSVVCFFAYPPCPPWFAFLRVLRGLLFPCPPHPQSQPSPNLFPFPFQPLPNSPFLLLLLLILYVESERCG